mmetsp:Transcript_13320/g.37999  ORF Transcript_13320/g.37999 Transcript_13320/m.37999 type:complete len:222 (+) Transcript_13320:1076-1741(+)
MALPNLSTLRTTVWMTRIMRPSPICSPQSARRWIVPVPADISRRTSKRCQSSPMISASAPGTASCTRISSSFEATSGRLAVRRKLPRLWMRSRRTLRERSVSRRSSRRRVAAAMAVAAEAVEVEVAAAEAIIVVAIDVIAVGRVEAVVEVAFTAVEAMVVVGDSPRSLRLMNRASPSLAVVSQFPLRVEADLRLPPQDGSIRRLRAVVPPLPNLSRPERRL